MLSADFTAVDARAKGLALHLFSRAELEALVGQDAASLARALSHSPKLFAPLPERATLVELERALRQTARHHLLTLSRWEGAGPPLGVFYAEQDRRSLRAMLRGALGTASSDERLAGLIPTPTLPERVLVELARQPTPAAVVSVLFAVGHPLAERLLPLTTEKQPDLLSLELATNAGWADWARREAKRGDAPLRQFVEQRVDALNVQAALLLREAKDVEPERCFLAGGRELTLEAFRVLARTPSAQPLPEVTGWLRPLLADVTADPSRFERSAFVQALSSARARARLEPLSSAPVLYFLLRLEAQARDLRRVVWASALAAPPVLVKPEFVMP